MKASLQLSSQSHRSSRLAIFVFQCALLLTLLIPAGRVWGQTITIGTETNTQNSAPIANFYNYSLSEMIFTADEIAAGNPTGNYILNVGFQLSSSGLNNKTYTVDIYMRNITDDEFEGDSFVILSDNEKVFTGTVSATTSGWITLELDVPFHYDNTKNLLIGVNKTSGGYAGSSYYWNYSTTTKYQNLYKQTDSSPYYDPSNPPTSPTKNYSRPNVQLTFGDTPTCFKPQNLTATLTEGNGTIATLNWARHINGTENAWVLQYSTSADFTGATTVNVAGGTPSKSLTGLTPEATYYARVKPDCDNDGTKWSDICEFTPSNYYKVTIGDGTANGNYAPLVGSYKSSYDQMIYTASQLENAGITGPCSITKIGFNSSAVNSIERKPVIYICHAPNDKSSFSDNSDFVSINEFTKVYDFNDHGTWSITAGWNEFTLDTPFDYDGSSNLIIAVHCGLVSSYSSSNFYYTTAPNTQVIYAYSDGTDPVPSTYEGNWSNYSYRSTTTNLPNLEIYYEPILVTCAKPTGLAVRNNTLTAHGVTMEWNAESGAQFDYAIVLGTGIDPTTVTYEGTTSNNFKSWSNLNADSDYTVFIRRNCGNGDNSQAATRIIHTEVSCYAPTSLAATPDRQTATITWVDDFGSSWQVAHSTDASANPDNNIAGTANTTSYTMNDLTLDQDHYFWVRTNCGSEGYSTWTGPVSAHIGYCVPTFGSNSDCITNITLGDINNTTPSSSTLGYGNYTNLSTTLLAGETTTLSLTSGSGSGTHAAAVWIDFNDNFVFESSERVGTQNSIGASATANIDLSIPSDAASGSHRLRVLYQYSVTAENINPCASASYGEAEDYTVEIVSATCPKPTNVTASNITLHAANVSWNSEGENYNVRYATATITGTTLEPVFEDGFENGIGNWTTYALGNYNSDNTDWHQYDATNFSSGEVTNHTGSYVAMSRSYDGTDRSVDNWLVSPQMTLGDVVKFYVCGDNAGWQEYYAVYVSTGSNAISDFTMVEAPELAPGDGTWAARTVDLSAYAGQQGYIAIRHTDEGKDYLLIDDFGVYNTINTYSYGTFTTLPSTTETSSNITNLNPETLYAVQVQADCGANDGISSWSSVYFTTPDACSALTDLASSNITSSGATLSWSNNLDNYNVQYRKVYFYEGFEGDNMPTGWTTIDANEDGNTWSIGHATTHTGNNGAANISYIYSSDNSINTTPDDYLVSPQLDLQGTLRVWLSGFGDNNAEHFEILLSTTGNSISDFTTTLVGETTTSNAYMEYTADLSSYTGQHGYIAIHHFNCTDQRYLYVDDFGLYGSKTG